jgi:hypothetical protein
VAAAAARDDLDFDAVGIAVDQTASHYILVRASSLSKS